jgi:tight adherence protein B
MVSAILFLVAILMMLAAVLSVLRARRQEQVARINERLMAVAFLPRESLTKSPRQGSLNDQLALWLNRVGLHLSPSTAILVIASVVVIGIVLAQAFGALLAMAWWLVAGIFTVLVPQIRYRQKVGKIVEQIPLFIDQVVRGLVTGRNVEGAIKLAAEDLQEPLKELITRAHRNVELGADLGEALKEAAQFHDIKELHMVALAINGSRVYGGSPREMLESVVNLIRQREQMQRELRAMTGETRVTAWVLGSLPTLLLAYMFWMNPDYIGGMWHHDTGRIVMIAAGTMQAIGALIMWRMIKSL